MNTKIDLAIYIANTLFGNHIKPGNHSVDDSNWKVCELMRKNKSELEALAAYAVRCRRQTGNAELLDV